MLLLIMPTKVQQEIKCYFSVVGTGDMFEMFLMTLNNTQKLFYSREIDRK